MSAPVEMDREAGRRASLTGALASTFLRGFAIQAGWNYHSMIGAGVAFALLPVLRRAYDGDPEALERALARQAEHFNAHPYLAHLAVGAAARLELDEEPEEMQRRFRRALRGPLGGLGDTLVWAGWLPATLLVGLASAGLGAPGWLAVTIFLSLYNAGHLGLRIWGFRIGLRAGRGVGSRLAEATLGHRAEQLTGIGAAVLGILSGTLLIAVFSSFPDPVTRLAWMGLAGGAFVAGYVGGQRIWRPTALTVVGAVGIVILTRMVA